MTGSDPWPDAAGAPDPQTTDAPRAKAPPPLDMRAPRPSVVRLRGSVVRLAVVGAAALVAGALTWAFVIQPELRSSAFDRRADQAAAQDTGDARPSEQIRDQPDRYDRLAPDEGLPPPRGAMESPSPAADPAPSAIGRGAPTSYPVASQSDPARIAAASGLFFARAEPDVRPLPAASPISDPPSRRSRSDDHDAVYSPHGLITPLSPYELQAGALLPATLLTAIDTARPGPVLAVLNQDVFDSVTGRHRLAPQGSRLIGRQEGDSAWGERRAFVIWERLILPNGRSIRLADAPGVDGQGAPGVRGRPDRRLVPLGVATLFAGAVTTLGEIARGGERDDRSWPGAAGNAASIEAAEVGGRLIDRELQVRPSIRVAPGARVQVMITRDLILEPYAP